MKGTVPTAVVFDVGNVLLRWDPRNLYRKMFDDEERMEWFLANVCTSAWNLEQDRGRDWDEAVTLLVDAHPDHETHIRAFHERWHETVPGAIEDNVAVLEGLRGSGVPTYCITNFSGPKFAEAAARYPFLGGFDGAIVSGDERVLKPDPAIYRLLLDRYGLTAGECIFIDDSQANVEGARAVGMQAIHFAEPMDLAPNCALMASRSETNAAPRLARPDEAAAVTALVRAAYGPMAAVIGREPGPMGDDYAAHLAAGRVHALDVDGRLAAILVLADEPDALLLDNVAVDPAFQGRGLGQRLVAFAEEEALRRGHGAVRLYTNVRMTQNIALYERLGFVETHRATVSGYHRVFMAKVLRP